MTSIEEFKTNNGTINVHKVVNSDLTFTERKQIIKDNPVSLYEILTNEKGKDHLNHLYKFAVEHGYEDLKNTILSNNIELINDKLAEKISFDFDDNGFGHQFSAQEMEKAIRDCRSRAYKNIDLLEEEKKKQDWFDKEKKRIEALSADFNKDFFIKLKKQFDKVDYSFEYAVIKLVSKLESKLRSTRKINDEEIDLEELINSRYQTEEERHLLHKLRITRNNYLHPIKEELNFTRDMFDKCLVIIFK